MEEGKKMRRKRGRRKNSGEDRGGRGRRRGMVREKEGKGER